MKNAIDSGALGEKREREREREREEKREERDGRERERETSDFGFWKRRRVGGLKLLELRFDDCAEEK